METVAVTLQRCCNVLAVLLINNFYDTENKTQPGKEWELRDVVY